VIETAGAGASIPVIVVDSVNRKPTDNPPGVAAEPYRGFVAPIKRRSVRRLTQAAAINQPITVQRRG
jgi:hypothetical protein